MSYLLLLTFIKAPEKQNARIVAGILSPKKKHFSYNPWKVMQLAFGNKYLASYYSSFGIYFPQ